MRALTPLLVPLACLLMAGAPPAPQPPVEKASTGPQPLAVAMPPTPARDPAARFLLKPYADATSTPLTQPGWDGSAAGLTKLLGDHAADLVLLDGGQLTSLCKTGAIQKLDWSTLGRDRFLPDQTTDCGAGAYLAATVLVWDRDKLSGTPGWPDFWDVAKHPGRRGLHRGARGNLEIALLADGVALGDVYRVLRSDGGVDRAFRKLDQLKPYILWWDQPAQAGQLVAGAKVLLTSAPAGARPAGARLHLGTQWAGGLQEQLSWAIPAGAPHPRAATLALAIATDPARLAELARATGLGVPTKPALALLPDATRAENPATPDNGQFTLTIDNGFWADNGEKLEGRFAVWVMK